ncbi:MAG: TIGR04255 family protein [Thermomicrobiales bacterium]
MNDPWELLEVRPRREFANPPIALAVAQVHFPERLSTQDPEVIARFHENIEKLFPETRQISGFSFEFAVGQPGDLQAGLSNIATPVIRQFHDVDQNWLSGLSPDNLTLECRKYEGFESFLIRFKLLVQALIDTVNPKSLRRLGLRYINEVRDGASPLPLVVNDELRGAQSNSALSNTLVTSHQIMQFVHGNTQVNLQHGLFPRGSTVASVSGSVPQDAFYLIDTDVVKGFPPPNDISFSLESALSLLQELHDTASRIFRWSISKPYEEFLGESS